MLHDFRSTSAALLERRHADPRVFSWVVAASALANILGLASSIYAIQIFNRYIGYGLDRTLLTLTFGALLAIALEYLFRWIRFRLAGRLFLQQDATEQYTFVDELNRTIDPPGGGAGIYQLARNQQQMQGIHSPSNFLTLLDIPFALIFILCIYLLNPLLGILVTIIAVAAILLASWHSNRLGRLQDAVSDAQHQLDTSLQNTARNETVRAFNLAPVMGQSFRDRLVESSLTRHALATEQNQQNANITLITAITSVAVIGIGAISVTQGQMDIGSLIGCNILAARAISLVNQIGRLGQSFQSWISLKEELAQAEALPRESTTGNQLPAYKGKLELKGLGHTFDEQRGPLFDQLNITLEPGSIALICGANGSGKTTLARIVAGLQQPTRGQILVDNLELQQIAAGQWRQSISYVPEDPSFLNLSLRDNLTSLNPGMSDEELKSLLSLCGVRELVDHHQDGLEQHVQGGGIALPPGVRKRLALARALASKGKLVILDEIHNGLDQAGLRSLMDALSLMMKEQRTILLCAHDRNVIKSRATIINLDTKPVPTIEVVE